MKQYKRSIKKDFIKKKCFIKHEIRKIILKSIIQDRNTNTLNKSLAVYKISCFKPYASISRQNNNICLKTGRYKGILKNTFFSRHSVKKLGKSNMLQNFKIASW